MELEINGIGFIVTTTSSMSGQEFGEELKIVSKEKVCVIGVTVLFVRVTVGFEIEVELKFVFPDHKYEYVGLFADPS
jgi:hypothetical protein